MSAEIFQFPPMEDHPTGAREAVRDAMAAANFLPHSTLEIYDLMLSELWVRGFKVVPIAPTEQIEAAMRDAAIFGSGFVSDGKHIDRGDVLAVTPPQEEPKSEPVLRQP